MLFCSVSLATRSCGRGDGGDGMSGLGSGIGGSGSGAGSDGPTDVQRELEQHLALAAARVAVEAALCLAAELRRVSEPAFADMGYESTQINQIFRSRLTFAFSNESHETKKRDTKLLATC